MKTLFQGFLLALLTFGNLAALETPCFCGHFIGSVDFLYWRPCADDALFITFLEKEVEVESGGIVSFFDEKEKDKFIQGDLEPGVRLAVQWQDFANTCWNFNVSWTYFCFTHRDSVSGEGYDNFSTLFVSRIDTTNPDSRVVPDDPPNGKWDLNLNIADIGISYTSCLGNGLYFTPETSLRYLCIDSDDVRKQDGELRAVSNQEFVSKYTIKEREENNFWGFGPRIGMNMDWHIGCGCGFYTNFAFGLLYGKVETLFRCKGERFKSESVKNNTNHIIEEFKAESIYCTRTSTDLAFGGLF